MLTAFTARTTRVSNPFCSPSFRSSQSESFWSDAFAIGSPPWINPFYRYPRNTSNLPRSRALQCLLHAVWLSQTISQEIYKACYERFRPNNRDSHSGRWGYRGGWHQSYPPLIRQAICTWQKPKQCLSTRNSLLTLACIGKFARLLHPVGLGPVSQCPSPGYHSHGPYGSLVWWSITPPTA